MLTMAETVPIPATAGSEDIPVPEWHRRILDERMEAYRANPEEGRPWEAVYEDLRRKLRDRRRTEERQS